MDLNYLLIWMAGISSASMLYRSMQLKSPGLLGRKVICILVLAVIGVGILTFPNTVGFIAGACWVVLILVPSLAGRWVLGLVAREHYRGAASLARMLGVLNPMDTWRESASIYTAMALAKEGAIDRAMKMLEPYRNRKDPAARRAVVQIFRLQERWAEALQWMDENMTPAEIAANPQVYQMQLRAWGETGRLDLLVSGFKDFASRFYNIPNLRNVARMYLVAFFGRVDLLPLLFDGPLKNYSVDIKERWYGKARAAQARLANSLSEAAQGAPLVAAIEQELTQETRYSATAAMYRFRPVVTIALIALNVAYFGVETLTGGSTEDSVLIHLGALLPGLFTLHDSWRLVAALFLHIGPLHLLMNMFGLWVLGQQVERILRPFKFIVLYLGAGIGSMAIVVVLYHLRFINYDLLAGASGAIMGLVGAIAAIALRDSRTFKTQASAARLRWAGSVLLIQFAFDASTPQVSMAGHLGGAVCGFALTLVLGAGG